MALVRRFDEVAKITVFFVGLATLLFCGRADLGPTVFDVTKYGATGDGESENAQAFIQAWNAACQSNGAAKVVIPPGTYLSGEVFFVGPCNCPKPIIVEVQGTVLAQTDLSEYPNGQWFSVADVDGLVVTGAGTFDGQGEASWQYDSCGRQTVCNSPLPPSIGFLNVNNTILEGVKLVNSKGINIKVSDSHNLTFQNLDITAPPKSPNTDGIHISNSDQITVKSCNIATGDDCISKGEGATNIVISAGRCTPGLGAGPLLH
ncbi:hypothetical protein RHSIM_Rhsim01G0287100 [Rhododendron simsii]|uniref:Polygalacturonase n=1 Tax=Rhododendron simsii TaxID=118357 RepID=A0A834HIP0_RHOSS|nr:hypothetical protein RHSIM_Rhsim01G0287100 [Rhododendron simsii]